MCVHHQKPRKIGAFCIFGTAPTRQGTAPNGRTWQQQAGEIRGVCSFTALMFDVRPSKTSQWRKLHESRRHTPPDLHALRHRRSEDGEYLPLNRFYKPIGVSSDEWVDYKTDPTRIKIKGLTDAKAEKIGLTVSKSQGANPDTMYYLYEDATNPPSPKLTGIAIRPS